MQSLMKIKISSLFYWTLGTVDNNTSSNQSNDGIFDAPTNATKAAILLKTRPLQNMQIWKYKYFAMSNQSWSKGTMFLPGNHSQKDHHIHDYVRYFQDV